MYVRNELGFLINMDRISQISVMPSISGAQQSWMVWADDYKMQEFSSEIELDKYMELLEKGLR